MSAAFRSISQTTFKVRYPETPIQHEAADLFNFASQVPSNPLLSFLSYYQVLEYFLPAAANKDIVEKLRRELRQTSFNEKTTIVFAALYTRLNVMRDCPSLNILGHWCMIMSGSIVWKRFQC